MCEGHPDDALQVILLGLVDRQPHLLTQDPKKGYWESDPEPFKTHQPLGYSAVASYRGAYDRAVVVLLDYVSNQPFVAIQNSDGSWLPDANALWSLAGQDNRNPPVPGGFKDVVMARGNSDNLQIVLLGTDDGLPYLFWQDAAGTFHWHGRLPSDQPEGGFKAMDMGRDGDGNLQLVMLGATDGIPYLTWQNTGGSWIQAPNLWVLGNDGVNAHPIGFDALTIHLGNQDNLQVVLLDAEGYPRHFWLKDGGGPWKWSDEALPNDSGRRYKAITSGYGRTGATNYLSVLMLDTTEGQIWQLYQSPVVGNWVSYDEPMIESVNHPGGFKAIACFQGAYEKHLDVITLGADTNMAYLSVEHDPWGIQTWEWEGLLPTDPMFAQLTRTPPLSVRAALQSVGAPDPETPGNVGLCISGGGSRSMIAGMGQLRALAAVNLNGQSLLTQLRALGTVSGGSWVGMTYAYLENERVSDSTFLGSYLPPESLSSESISKVPEGQLGNVCLNGFSMESLVAQAIWLLTTASVQPDQIWQVLIGLHVLAPYGLYVPGGQGYPCTSMTFSPATEATIVEQNPALRFTRFNVVADQGDTSRNRRPFPIGNMAMRVTVDGAFHVAPVQGTPLFTGIVGAPDAVDANDRAVGGGGVTSFGFNSLPYMFLPSSDTCLVFQARQWSLMDVVGVSSAALAAGLWSLLETKARAMETPEDLRAYLASHPEAVEIVRPCIPEHAAPRGVSPDEERLRAMFRQIKTLTRETSYEPIPMYNYWPVRDPRPEGAGMNATRFADAGFLDNSGIASMLAYDDIERIIAFTNTSDGMSLGDKGAIDELGNPIPNTNIIISDQITVLFGYQPYDPAVGYVPFSRGVRPGLDYLSKVQVFPSSEFASVLQGLWQASGSGAQSAPAIFRRTHAVLENAWFGVRGGRSVEVLWSYLMPVGAWYAQLQPAVQQTVDGISDFPRYGTFDTGLSAQQVNLLASLTSWCVADSTNKQRFLDMFL